MCQSATLSMPDLDDDHAEWTGDSRYVRPFHPEDMLARYEDADDTVDFEMASDPEDDDEDDDDDDDEDDDEDEDEDDDDE